MAKQQTTDYKHSQEAIQRLIVDVPDQFTARKPAKRNRERPMRGMAAPRMKRPLIIGVLIALFLWSKFAWPDISAGSGFFISEDGHFVTNYHVVKGADEIIIRDARGKSYSVKVVRVDKINDLAILKAEGHFLPLPIANSRSAKRGQSVITVGYPHVDVQGLEPKVTNGIINSLSGMGDDPRVFQISVPVQSGNSGGPLVTQEGNVIGVVVSKLSALALWKETGDLPQNVNYAVKSNYLLEVISSLPEVEAKLAKISNKGFKDIADLTAYIEKATAIVIANKSSPSSIKANPAKTTPGVAESPRPPDTFPFIKKILDGQYSSGSIAIKAPDLAENGAVVPLEVFCSIPIIEGEVLYIVVNDEYISHTVRPYGQISLESFSVRSRMPGSGYLRGVVVDKKGNVKAASKEVRVTVGANMSSTEGAGRFLFKSGTVKSYNKAGIKMLLNNPMSLHNYVRSIRISYPGRGYIEIDMTPAASKNPFLAVTTTGTENFSRYEIEFVLSDGQRHAGSGEF